MSSKEILDFEEKPKHIYHLSTRISFWFGILSWGIFGIMLFSIFTYRVESNISIAATGPVSSIPLWLKVAFFISATIGIVATIASLVQKDKSGLLKIIGVLLNLGILTMAINGVLFSR